SERDDAPARAQAAAPEQLTSAAWNCQYPSPSPSQLVVTCARSGSLDVYALPLDGAVPSEWSAERLESELSASRHRWERLLLLPPLLRKQAAARVSSTLEIIRLHLLLGELESATFFVRKLDALADPATLGMGAVLLLQIDHRRAERLLERGRMSARFVAE